MKSNLPEKMIKEGFGPYVKKRKAKNSYGCIYKKENDYFWSISYTTYSRKEIRVVVKIKLWHYDELLNSITNPDEIIHFPDKMRWNGFSAMDSIWITDFLVPDLWEDESKVVSESSVDEWCRMVFEKSILAIDDFIESVKTVHGNLNEFLISKAEDDPLMAAFAFIDKKEYETAKNYLQTAVQKNMIFRRSYGSFRHDLRDVLIDYCVCMLNNDTWNREKVIGSGNN